MNPSSKGDILDTALLLFFGQQTKRVFYSRVALLGFCNVSISCHLTVKACQFPRFTGFSLG